MKGDSVMLASLKPVFEQGLAASSQHNIETVGEALQRTRCVEVESCSQTIRRRLVGDGCDDGIVGDERISLEIHLGYSLCAKPVPNTEKWMWAGRQLLMRFRKG